MRAEGGAAEAAPSPPSLGRFERLVEHLAVLLAMVGGGILIALSLMVSASILGRWLLNREITGAFEVVQVGVAVAAFLFLPVCQLRNQNIIVDSFTARASLRAHAWLDATWAAIYALIALVLAERLAVGAAETIRSQMVTPMLRVPYGWAMVAGSAALVFLALVSTLVALRHLRETAR